jgi:histidyl-tRNA synthetase
VVEKEMYSFLDKGGNDITLRAEGTAPIVRAYLERGLHAGPQPVRLYSLISVFRYDRPQAGRLREHHQLDCEALGDGDPTLDGEIITLLWRYYEALGLAGLSLQMNSIGCPACRPLYVERLRGHYAEQLAGGALLCGDCRRRLERNPLRLLDCKVPGCQPTADAAPGFAENLCAGCTQHFAHVRGCLAGEEIPDVLNKRLVRGFDYYTRTVFEVWPPETGAQASIGGGGRYDGLAEELGGRATPGVGFGTGLERLILNLRRQGVAVEDARRSLVYVAHLSDDAEPAAAAFARQLRRRGVATLVGVGARSLRTRLRHADAAGVRWTAVFGEDEVRNGSVSLRDMAVSEPAVLPVEAGLDRVAASLGGGAS